MVRQLCLERIDWRKMLRDVAMLGLTNESIRSCVSSLPIDCASLATARPPVVDAIETGTNLPITAFCFI